ncbi:M20 family metallopeptidase [Bacillus sp. 1P06AnD]|uniref:M20 family metallopeptidase n=1 Tax=Bacillus sp. 1P06AnD TaxID=3132208 RepID=UPI0039A156D5
MKYFQERVAQIIEDKREELIEVSNRIWEYAELGYEEKRSASLLCDMLEKEGFTVEREAGGIETAFIGSYGSGNPVIAIMGEFDALTGLSQEGGVSEPNPIVKGGNGHGCGHNLLGTGALAAAIALRYYMEENGMNGTIRYYGCPAEEAGAGKTHMVREGLFSDVDIALSWHPGSHNLIWNTSSLACLGGTFRFEGRSSHAAASPHLGRSALDAVELMNVGVNYLREHIIPEARIHYAITNAGGYSPNVVQAEAEVFYYIRAPKVSQARDLFKRVADIARGAALMTGTEAVIPSISGLSNLVPNTVLNQVMFTQLDAYGAPAYNAMEQQFARELQSSLSKEDVEFDIKSCKELRMKALSDMVEPFEETDACMFGSTDVGDVSWVVPTAQCNTSTWVLGTPAHTWQVVAIGTTSIAHKGMLLAGKVIAATALEVLEHPEIIEKAKQELNERLDGESYVSPLSDDVYMYKKGQKQ